MHCFKLDPYKKIKICEKSYVFVLSWDIHNLEVISFIKLFFKLVNLFLKNMQGVFET